MIKKIEITIDTEKKGIIDLKIPDELNPVEVTIILNAVQSRLLSGLEIEPKSKIITPDKKIKIGA